MQKVYLNLYARLIEQDMHKIRAYISFEMETFVIHVNGCYTRIV